MGITIHYNGSLNIPRLAEEITRELTDISSDMDWKYNVIKDSENTGIAIYLIKTPNLFQFSLVKMED